MDMIAFLFFIQENWTTITLIFTNIVALFMRSPLTKKEVQVNEPSE